MNDSIFTYTISSSDCVSGGTPINCEIDVGGIGSNFDSYQVEVISLTINGSTLVGADDYFILTVTGLAENAYSSLGSNECMLGTMMTNNKSALTSRPGCVFNVKNMTSVRRLRFKLLNPDKTPVLIAKVNNAATTVWVIALLFRQLDFVQKL